MGVLVQGQTATALGKYDVARSLLDEALTLARQAGDPFRAAMALNFLGDLARCQRQDAQAQAPYEEAAALLRQLGAERDLAGTLQNLGHTCLHLGNVERAQALFDESMALQQAQGNTPGMVECLIGFAAIAVARGLPAAGARLLAAVAATGWEGRAWEWPATRMDYEQALARVRAQLTEAELQAEQAAGRARSLEQAVEDALHLPLPLPGASQGGMGTAQALTAREREVVILIAQGQSNAEIADELVLSKRTVEKHIANILSELGLTSRAQVVRWAIAQGLLEAAS
jgi:DNA-binding CsgD family transcriptional regulator